MTEQPTGRRFPGGGRPGCLATAIGSMPHTDPAAACDAVLLNLSDIPPWPQLPRRSALENMYIQYSEGFPGVVVEGDHIHVDRLRNLDEPLAALYVAYLENAVDRYAVSPEYAAGLQAFLAADRGTPVAVKGQVTGPISWGLTVTDQDRRPILYDDILADAVAKHLRLKAGWMEKTLSALTANVIIFLDEPYMNALGSAFVSIPREQVAALLCEVLGGLTCLRGVHCCGNTDWSILLETPIDILSFDACNYTEALSLYPTEVQAFLDRGGTLAWGIVPNEEQALAPHTTDTLLASLQEAMEMLAKKGIKFEDLVRRSLITPSCGLGTMSVEGAERALMLTASLSRAMREQYRGLLEMMNDE
ncbi:MAG: methionine synthase [Chloroflexi bacterium]|nr:methionine synthase [Chloroflexota bacterium]